MLYIVVVDLATDENKLIPVYVLAVLAKSTVLGALTPAIQLHRSALVVLSLDHGP